MGVLCYLTPTLLLFTRLRPLGALFVFLQAMLNGKVAARALIRRYGSVEEYWDDHE